MPMDTVPGAYHWVRRWIGLPFELGGRGPEAFDCWGLVRAVYEEQLGIRLPSLRERYEGLDEAQGAELWPALAELFAGPERATWRELGESEPRCALDAVLIRRGKHVCHVGLVAAVQPRRVMILHIERGTHSVVVPSDGPEMRRHIVGFYRHEALEAE